MFNISQYQKPWPSQRLNTAHPLSKGLVGCWIMNEKGGLYAYDLSRYKNVGTLTGGPVWAFDGVLFDGSNYIDCGDSDAFSFGDGPFTLCSLIYPLSSATDNAIVTKYEDNSPFDGEWHFISKDDDALYFQCLDDGSSVRIKITGSQTVSLNKWSSVSARYAGGDSETSLDLFVNGIKDPSSTKTKNGSYTAMTNQSTPVSIGVGLRNSIYDSWMNGYIKYVFIFNRSLLDKEITDIHINPYAMLEDPYPIELFGYVAAGQELSFYTKTDSQFNTPAMILNNSRILKSLAPAQFSTSTAALQNSRTLNSSISVQFTTEDIALLNTLGFYSKADGRFMTTDISVAINRILNTKINNVFTTDSAMLNLQRSLKSKPFAQYVTSDIDITVSGLVEFFSRISCGFTTSDIIAAIYRALNTKVDTVFTAESIILAVQRSLYSKPSAQFITSDINVIISGLIEFYSKADCTFSTSNIDLVVTGILEFFSRAECAFSTADVVLAVQRVLAARAANTFTTNDIELSIGALPLEFYTKVDCAFNASDIVLLLTRKLNSKISAQYVTADIAIKALLRLYGKADCIFSTRDINLISDELGIILNTSTTSITKERIFTSITADRMAESITTDRQVFNKET